MHSYLINSSGKQPIRVARARFIFWIAESPKEQEAQNAARTRHLGGPPRHSISSQICCLTLVNESVLGASNTSHISYFALSCHNGSLDFPLGSRDPSCFFGTSWFVGWLPDGRQLFPRVSQVFHSSVAHLLVSHCRVLCRPGQGWRHALLWGRYY
jgi:hypothetical protein